MTDIRFLNELGENLEDAARRNQKAPSGKRPYRRRLLIGLAVIATTATGIAAASQIFGNPDSLAANSIGCYASSDRSGNVTILGADGESPLEVCARIRAEVEKLPPTRLVACADGEVIAVFPGTDCAKAGLEPIPAGYQRSVERFERLSAAIGDLEMSSGCISPERLADEALEILERQGWEGWIAEFQGDEDLPCGLITSPTASGNRTLSGALNTNDSIIYVFRTRPRD